LVGKDPLILVLYVDDIFITEADKIIVGCKKSISLEFEMKYIGLMHYFGGLDIWKEPGHIFMG